MPEPLLSLIIPTCGRLKELALCLERLHPQMPENGRVELLICDDGKDDAARAMLAEGGLESAWRQGPRRGPAANRNSGARAARGEWLLFLDDDCEPRPEFLSTYLTAIERLGTATRIALEGATHAADPAASLLWEAPHNPDGGSLISCNFAIPRRVFIENGGFDERFPMASFEDTEFAARLEREGVATLFLPLAAVDHPLRPLPPAAKRARRWEARVISSYDFGASTSQILWRLPRHIALVTLSRFRGRPLDAENFRAAFSFFAEAFLAIAQVPRWLLKYHRAPRSPFWQAQVGAGTAPPRFGL